MDEEILNTTEEIENEEEPIVEANTQSADASANSTSSSEEITRILQLIKTRTLETGDTSISWKDLVEFLKNEKTHLGNTPIYEDNFQGNTTLFSQINDKADMDEGNNSFDYTAFANKLVNNPNVNFWNESVGDLVRKVAGLLGSSEGGEWSSASENGGIEYTDTIEDGVHTSVSHTHGSIGVSKGELKSKGGFRVKSIKNANAGNDFGTRNSTWVIPNYNIDAETYAGVRGNDKITKVLNNSKELQFTHTQDQSTITTNELNKYLRLIMPKYLRRVEVEDLNRNFWVIGQTLSAISAFLFDENGPLPEIFKGILSEITQLWENIMYLWAGLAAEQNATKYTKVHTEVVYLPNNELEDHMSYDNFIKYGENWEWEKDDGILDRLAYLIDSYPKCNLCIIPVIRYSNYEHNYYKGETWPGIVFYDRNKEYSGKHGFYWLNFWDNDLGDNRGHHTADDDDLQSSGSGFQINGNTIRYIYPMAGLAEYDISSEEKFLFAIRTIPTVKCTYDLATGFKLEKGSSSSSDEDGFRIDYIDIGLDFKQRAEETTEQYAENLNHRRIAYLRLNKTVTIAPGISMSGKTRTAATDELSWVVDYDSGTSPDASIRTITLSNKGFYQGEVMSTTAKSEAKYNLGISKVSLWPVINDSEAIENGKVESLISKNSTTMLLTILGDENLRKKPTVNYEDNQFKFYIGTHKNALYKSDSYTTNQLNGFFADNSGKPKWFSAYSDKYSSDYNASRERYDAGLVLRTPWNANYRFDDYLHVSLPFPTVELNGERGTMTVDGSQYDYYNRKTNPLPNGWKGGRTGASFITLSSIKSTGSIGFNRNTETLVYYYVWTKNGKKPTKNTPFILFLNQVVVNYGMFTSCYKSGAPEYFITENNYTGNNILTQKRIIVPISNASEVTFISAQDANNAIDDHGRQTGGNYPLGWDSDKTLNSSAFISDTRLGFPVTAEAFVAMCQKVGKNAKSWADNDINLTVTYNYIDNCRVQNGTTAEYQIYGKAVAGEIGTDSNGNKTLTITVYRPMSWSKETYNYGSIPVTYKPQMLRQIYYIYKKSWSNIDVSATGNISRYFGSVMDIKTYRFDYDPTKSESNRLDPHRTAWYSRFYYDTNGNYTLQSIFEDLLRGIKNPSATGDPSSKEMLEYMNSTDSINGAPGNEWKLAYAGDLNGENVKNNVNSVIKSGTVVTGANFYNTLVKEGHCPYFDHYHYNGYVSHNVT